MTVTANSSYFPKHNSLGDLSNTKAMSALWERHWTFLCCSDLFQVWKCWLYCSKSI